MRAYRILATILAMVFSSLLLLGMPASSAPTFATAAAAPGTKAGGDPVGVAREHLRSHAADFGLSEADAKQFRVSSVVPSEHNGLTHVYLQQQVDSIDVFNAQVNIAVTDGGEVEYAASSAIGGAAKLANGTAPEIPDVAAARRAAQDLGLAASEPFDAGGQAQGPARARTLGDGGISFDPIPVHLVYQPTKAGGLRLSWELVINQLDGEHWWQTRVDARTGDVLGKNDWVAYDGYRVYPAPVEAPSFGGRQAVLDPAHGTASPFGWHDTNGAAGAESTLTDGNNVSAYTDTDANNVPDLGSQPDGGGSLTFDFPLDLSQPPSAYRPAAVTNLFYWNNTIHDVFYRYGFTEAAGNFQVNNYGRGGLGLDAVRAEAQDGSGTNNANFATPPDGSAPRMQMYVWTAPTPDRDGDLDNGIIVHEYGHGISNRLTGGPANAGCLGNAEQGGEGWSDWFSLMLTMDSGVEPAAGRGIGTYALNQPTDGAGIRTQKYSTDQSINTMTYDSIKTLAVPHGVGSVWAEMLWEVTWAMIDEYGYSPDLIGGDLGNNKALQLVMDGLKLQPCSPGFVDARNAILAADQATGGADECLLWTAFAKRGLGFSASQGSSSSVTDGVQAFDLPPVCNGLQMTRTDTPDPVPAGGQVTYRFRLENTSEGALTGVNVTSDLGDNSTYVPSSATCGGTYDGGTDRVTFAIGSMALGAIRNCTYQVTVDPSPWSTLTFEDDFEPDLSAWTTTHGSGVNDWALTTTEPSSPTHAAFAADPAVVSDQRLTTAAPVAIGAGGTLTFAHKYDTEPGYDGGVVEVSADGGSTWADVGAGNWLRNGYNSTLSTCCSNPLPGRQAFSGNSSGYVTSEADLSDYAGQNVLVRFRAGSDNTVGDTGWWVDDVRIGDEVLVLNDATAQATGIPTQSETISTRVVEPAAPGPVTVTAATPMSSTTARVAFTPTSDGGSPITSYRAQCTSSDGGTTRAADRSASPITVGGLSTGSTYRCRVRATNANGTGPFGAYSAPFVQQSKPAPPTVTSSTPQSATSTEVAFTPGDDGGSPVTSFQAQCTSSDGGTARTASGGSSPVTVTGLTAGRTYRCRVRATNAVGTSAFSAYGSPFLQGLPPAPPTVTSSTPISATSARVTFTPGAAGGSPITGFTITCASTDGGVTRTRSGTASPITVPNLSTGSTYRCRGRATNAVGTGNWGAFGSTFVQSAP